MWLGSCGGRLQVILSFFVFCDFATEILCFLFLSQSTEFFKWFQVLWWFAIVQCPLRVSLGGLTIVLLGWLMGLTVVWSRWFLSQLYSVAYCCNSVVTNFEKASVEEIIRTLPLFLEPPIYPICLTPGLWRKIMRKPQNEEPQHKNMVTRELRHSSRPLVGWFWMFFGNQAISTASPALCHCPSSSCRKCQQQAPWLQKKEGMGKAPGWKRDPFWII